MMEGDDALPAGVRPLRSLEEAHASAFGPEAVDLAELLGHKVPVAPGLLVRVGGDKGLERAVAAIHDVARGARHVRLRPLFPSRSAAVRYERRAGLRASVAASDALEEASAVLDILKLPELTAALGGSIGGVLLRVIACDAGAMGRAASTDPLTGDPDVLAAWSVHASAAPFRVDRKSMRIATPGEVLDAGLAEDVADLADRVQLVLGRPIELEWCTLDGRPHVVTLRSLPLRSTFAQGSFRRVALVEADEGTVAPLAIDALDRALARTPELSVERTVRRIYARPYRLMAPMGTTASGSDTLTLARAMARAARVARDVAAPLAAARSFELSLGKRLAMLDAADLRVSDDDGLIAAVRKRQLLVAEALRLLDNGREATLAVLAALEATVGHLPRDTYPALAAPRAVRARRRAHDRLRDLRQRLGLRRGQLPSRPTHNATLERRWDETRAALRQLRPLGIDLRPLAFGADEPHFAAALRDLESFDDNVREKARRDAVRRLLATARSRAMGRTREGIAASLTLLLSRVAAAKGSASEGLAASLSRLRGGACEVGRRLVEAGVLDQPDDALYLWLSELEEAIAGEPGAYAARVRLRREDDARWARFDAPRRLDGQLEMR